MKKLFFAVPFSFLLLNSCTAPGGSSAEANSTAQKNLAAVHMIDSAFLTGNPAAVDSVVAPDFLDHTDHGDVRGRDSLKKMISTMGDYVKDMKMEKIRDLADSDYVFEWNRYTGNSTGAMGMPPGPINMHAIEINKFKDGKVVEHWSYGDGKEMMEMMQKMQAAGKGMGQMMNNMDTAKTKK